MLDDIEELRDLFKRRGSDIRATRTQEHKGYVPPGYEIDKDPPRLPAGDLFCAECGGPRKMHLRALYVPVNFPENPRPEAPVTLDGPVSLTPEPAVRPVAIAPSLFSLMCSQCSGLFTLVVVRRGPEERALVLPQGYGGGVGTLRTPPSVRYYLDQAHLSRAIGAQSAAVAMYRAALEHVLYEQGYKQRMLGRKIEKLEKDVEKGEAPAWASDLDPEYMSVIKRLGDAAIHPNDGDVEAQRSILDKPLLFEVDALFTEILEAAYELPRRREARLEALREAQERLEGLATPARPPDPAAPGKGPAAAPE